jgi:predicted RNA-binding Zn ribbon-like protein
VVDSLPVLPVLGEPFIAEFANSRYSGSIGVVDVFDRSAWAIEWFATAPCAKEINAPVVFSSIELARLRRLRDALRTLLGSDSDLDAAVDVVNATAMRARPTRILEHSPTGFRVVVEPATAPFDSLLSTIAGEVLDAVERGDLDRVRPCRRPACTLYFVASHHRRRYCNSRCANAHRQSRYHQRLRERAADR